MNHWLEILVVVLLVLGLATEVHPPARHDVEEEQEFTRLSETRVLELTSSESGSEARLQIQVKVDSGRVDWVLVDPTGVIRLTGEGNGGRVRGDTGRISRPPAGVWKLELGFYDASGRWQVHWHAE